MNAHFAFWFPAFWTMLGAIFAILSFAFSVYVAVVRRDIVTTRLKQICDAVMALNERPADPRLGSLEALQRDVGALTMALTPHGESVAETLRDSLHELTTDLQALVAATRETHRAVSGLTTDLQAPATPVLLEILAELRKLTKDDLKIQRRLAPFSLSNFIGGAYAERLARERIQATPSSFHELD